MIRHGIEKVEGGTRFSVWAPKAKQLQLRINEEQYPMQKDAEDYYSITLPITSGDYTYLLDGRELADPASRWQPKGVFGPSRIPPDFEWSDHDWQGIALKEIILYELHVGTFTPEGTFEAIIPKLPYLKDVGITAIELMPVAAFSGSRNWGYDGVFLFAVQESYGGPQGLKKLVDACHKEGFAVVMDVVYNHFGPEGCVLQEYAPYTTNNTHTPWGNAIDYSRRQVRDFAIENALLWQNEYHMDALRLDAIQEIYDDSEPHILKEMAAEFHKGRGWMTAESDLNQSKVIENPPKGYGIDSQWNDDFHHSLHTLMTGVSRGYFHDFGEMHNLQKAITSGFVYDGIYSEIRDRLHGDSTQHLPGEKFIVFTQNHDQIANASGGRRHRHLLEPSMQKTAGAILFFAPNLPMLFMGQEYGSDSRFDFFSDFSDHNIGEAVRMGRLKEYESLGIGDEFHDPTAIETFQNCILNWDDHDEDILSFFRQLIALRKKHPALHNCRKDLTEVDISEKEKWIVIHRKDPDGGHFILSANLSEEKAPLKRHEGFDEIMVSDPQPSDHLLPQSCRIEIKK